MIKICTALCPENHPVYSHSYDGNIIDLSIVEARTRAIVTDVECPECGSPGPFTIQHNETAFATHEETASHINRKA